jgi:hypothetical protein
MSKFRSEIDLQQHQLKQAVLHILSVCPSSPEEGQMYYDKENHAAYIWNGSNWAVWGSEPSSGDPGLRQFFLNLVYPTGREDFAIARVCEDLQIIRIDAVVNARDNLAFHVLTKRGVQDAGTPVTEEPILVTPDSVEITRFSNPQVSADGWLWFKTMAKEGEFPMFTITITCKSLGPAGTTG